ncbi:acyl carrier protein [Kibdelosporangium banguiense]|uniref:Acyl carrier protein n=1 Tax=Kibdelosporangium banguiense TaxID=1365924 RepID=A0ABS4U1M2_9PSEU|nr:acyl carrier protein [Kibdelosporangium banguiense]MBP2330535.1 acyl carrier protein [Kibdelosporangium banguiense]
MSAEQDRAVCPHRVAPGGSGSAAGDELTSRGVIIDDIESAIRSVLITDLFVEVPPERMSVDDGLRSEFGLDSLGFVELRVQCENKFGVTVSDTDFSPENFTSIRTVATLVRDLQARSEVSSS